MPVQIYSVYLFYFEIVWGLLTRVNSFKWTPNGGFIIAYY